MAAYSNEYEAERIERIARNKRKMEEIGVLKAKADFDKLVNANRAASIRRVRKAVASASAVQCRRSTRERPKVNYCEDAGKVSERVPRLKGVRRVTYLNRDDLEGELPASPKIRSLYDSGKGVRLQGGRIYDSKLGVTCHWCRQKTVESKVTCTHPECGKGRRLPTSFCRMCLHNRHGEDVEEAEASGKWICPGCRGSCGPGCSLCCNCGPCRKQAGLAPTGQLIKEACRAGFDNVHDYLVHQATGQPAQEIADRKLKAAWSIFAASESKVEEASPSEDSNGKEREDESKTANEPMSITRKQAATADIPFAAVKTAAPLGGECSGRAARVAARKLRIMTAVGLMAPVAA